MNNYIFILCLLCLLRMSGSYAQEIELKGTITNEKEVEGIHILNTTSRFNSVTNQTGDFTIRANKLDTLIVSSIHYVPERIVVSSAIYEQQVLTITLSAMVNELDEVVLGPNLSGNLATDLKSIKTEEIFNFDDVGIPGFKGKPEEKIVPAYTFSAPTAVNLEALYNHLSGYYKKLRKLRKWEAENNTVVRIMNFYTPEFFEEAYGIPKNRSYDFMLYCLETTQLQSDFNTGNYARVIMAFESQGPIYVTRLSEEKEE